MIRSRAITAAPSAGFFLGSTLDMRFADGLYRGATTGDLTFSRASVGYAETVSGDWISFASGAVRITDKGFLIEESRTNSILRSDEFDRPSWTKTDVTVSENLATSPFRLVNADLLTATAANGTVVQAVSTAAVSWTFSVFLRRVTGTGSVQITMDGTTWVTQSITSTGWTRCSVTQTGVAGTSNPGIRIVTSGDAVYAVGAQAELGAFATSPIPTTAASVTRAADAVTLSGAAFTAWYGTPSAYTIYTETNTGTGTSSTQNQYFAAISDATLNNRASIFRLSASANLGTRVVTGGAATNPGTITSGIVDNAVTKSAVAVGVGTNLAISVSRGTLSTAASPAALPATVSVMSIGQQEAGGGSYLNGYISRLAFIPARLANSELQVLAP